MSTALVTGASGGIGREIASQLAGAGYDLILVARRADALSGLAAQLCAQHRVNVAAQDLGEPGAVVALMRQIGEARIDILVNNAGRGDYGLFADLPAEHHRQTILLNVLALTELVRALLPAMKARRSGQIVNIASTAAFQPLPWMASYAATKAYVLNFGEALRYELRDSGVRVLTVCPGPTRTGFAAEAGGTHAPIFPDANSASATDVAAFTFDSIRRGRSGVAFPETKHRIAAFIAPRSPRRLALLLADRMLRPVSRSSRRDRR